MNEALAEELAEAWIAALRKETRTNDVALSPATALPAVAAVLSSLRPQVEASEAMSRHSVQLLADEDRDAETTRRILGLVRQAVCQHGDGDLLRATLTMQEVFEDRLVPALTSRHSSNSVTYLFRELLQTLAVTPGSPSERPHDVNGAVAGAKVGEEVAGESAQALVENSRQWRSIVSAVLASAPHSTAVLDLNGVVLAWNEAMAEITGYTQEDAIGRPFVDVGGIQPACCECTADGVGWQRDRASWQRVEERDTVIRRRDGHQVTVRARLVPHVDERGEPDCVVCTFFTPDARKQLEHLKDEFISIASHELRTPLTSIKGYATLLLREGRFDRRMVETIVQQSNLMARLVGDLLDVSLLRNGQIHLCQVSFEVSEVAARVIEYMSQLHPDHRFSLRNGEEVLEGRGDRDRVEQVLSHLIENAVIYSPPGSTVSVTIERGKCPDREADGTPPVDSVVVSVSDQGIGITPEDIPYIFDRFYRSNDGEVQQVVGGGMGLYRAKLIVERHGGRVWVQSTPGSGSTFSFSLPLATESDR